MCVKEKGCLRGVMGRVNRQELENKTLQNRKERRALYYKRTNTPHKERGLF
jgi:hypothetical protein